MLDRGFIAMSRRFQFAESLRENSFFYELPDHSSSNWNDLLLKCVLKLKLIMYIETYALVKNSGVFNFSAMLCQG